MRFIPASLHVTRDIQHYYCMAHIRRMFGEAVNYDKERATWAVETVAGLYKRKKNIREAGPPLTDSQIVEKRMAEVSSILSQLKDYPDIQELQRSCRGRGSK